MIMTVSYESMHRRRDDDVLDERQVESSAISMANREKITEMEPFSLVDEVEFSRRFREIAMMADDDSNDMTFLQSNCNHNHNIRNHRHSLSLEFPDGNNGFNSRLMDPVQLGIHTPRASRRASHQPSPTSVTKSFLDDDWLLDRVEHDSNMALVAAGLVRPRSAFHFEERTNTPLPEEAYRDFYSLNVSANSSPNRDERHHHDLDGAVRIYNTSRRGSFQAQHFYENQNTSQHNTVSHSHTNGPPPNDYICKLCNIPGHWLNDCEYFEPRNTKPSTNTAKGLFKNLSSGGSGHKHAPPGNYICRLCGVSGHWIEQCSMFQPKHSEKYVNQGKDRLSCFKSIPPPPGYICNLCHSPGHWLQQCSKFEPIGHRRRDHHMF